MNKRVDAAKVLIRTAKENGFNMPEEAVRATLNDPDNKRNLNFPDDYKNASQVIAEALRQIEDEDRKK